MTLNTLRHALLLNSLCLDSTTAGCAFYMTVDQAHSHQNSSQCSVSTLGTFVDEITLQDKVGKKEKKIVKNTPKKPAPANWSKTEVNTLVGLLKLYGSDFTMIATKMDKTRDQIKRKFKVFQKKFPELANSIFERSSTPLLDQNEFLLESQL